MFITFLGTSAGKPTLLRNLSAVALQYEQKNDWYLIDCGEATQHRIMQSNLRLGKLTKIFITHLHGDHLFGLPGLLASRSMEEIRIPLEIYGPKGIKRFIETVRDTTKHKIMDNCTINEFDEEGAIYSFDTFDVKVIPLDHSISSFAFAFFEYPSSPNIDVDKLKKEGIAPGRIYGEIKKGKNITLEDGRVIDSKEYLLEPIRGRRVIIAGDNCDPLCIGEDLRDLDLLVHESTYTQKVFDNLEKKVKHTRAKDLALAAKEYGVRYLIATHISPRYMHEPKKTDKNISLMKNEILEHYGKSFYIANDLDVFKIDKKSFELVNFI